MRIERRFALASTAVAALAACATTGGTTTTPTTPLTPGQMAQYGATFLTAISPVVDGLTGAISTKIIGDFNLATAAVQTIAGAITPSTSNVQAFITAAQTLLTDLGGVAGLSPTATALISAGLGIVSIFASSIGTASAMPNAMPPDHALQVIAAAALPKVKPIK